MNRHLSPLRRHARARFTLVELLIVVAILALLASLMLPALQSAMESGRQTACMNNMKQIGTALVVYTEGFNGSFPWRRQVIGWNGSSPLFSPGTFNEETWNYDLAMVYWSVDLPLTDNAFYWQEGDVKKYIPKDIPYICPTMNARMWDYGNWWTTYACPTSYAANPAWAGGLTKRPALGNFPYIHQITRPDLPMILDSGLGSIGPGTPARPGVHVEQNYCGQSRSFFRSLTAPFPSFPGFWHGRKGPKDGPLLGETNQLCLDGRVKAISASDVPKLWSSGNMSSNGPISYFTDLDKSYPLP